MKFDISKCKPFDLERALAGDKVVTRCGEQVLQVLHAEKAKYDMRVISILENEIGTHYDNGMLHENSVSDADLFMAPKEPVVTRKYFMLAYDKHADITSLHEIAPDIERWYMYIEYHDGEPVNTVFAKDVK